MDEARAAALLDSHMTRWSTLLERLKLMFEYLSVATLLISDAAQDGDVGVREIEGIDANAARPQSGYGGRDTFPDVWTKAAAYAHDAEASYAPTRPNTAEYLAIGAAVVLVRHRAVGR
ncbi:MAG: hypothetical protein ACOH2Q_18855 [Rhodococcus sp. (in: high G+C Gram-positive bacteria)]